MMTKVYYAKKITLIWEYLENKLPIDGTGEKIA